MGQHSHRIKLRKLDSILPLIDYQIKSNYHSLQYDRDQSRANKSSTGSNHATHKNHYNSSHLNPHIGNRQYAAKKKKEKKWMVNLVSIAKSQLKSSSSIYIPRTTDTAWATHMNIPSERLTKPTKFMDSILDSLFKFSTTNNELPAGFI